MNSFQKRQKIILGVLTGIVAVGICYYVYAKEGSDEIESFENTIAVESSGTEEKEEYSDEVILVHVSGAVMKEGVVELKVNARVSDAIEKARWSERRSVYRGY